MKPKLEYIKEDKTKNNRMTNISIFMVNEIDKTGHAQACSAFEMRDEIDNHISTVILEGEKLKGDRRAHGDAYGKGGLDLQRTGVAEKCFILLNDANYAKCIEHLRKNGYDV